MRAELHNLWVVEDRAKGRDVGMIETPKRNPVGRDDKTHDNDTR